MPQMPNSPGQLLPPDVLFQNVQKPVAPAQPQPAPVQSAAPAQPASAPDQVQQTAPPKSDKPAAAVTFSEPNPDLTWMQSFKAKIAQGHQPTSEEIQKFNRIQLGLAHAEEKPVSPTAAVAEQPAQAAAPAPVTSQAPAAAPQPATPAQAAGITQQELEWAQAFEQKVNQGHQPSQADLQRYQEIANRVAAAGQEALMKVADNAPFSREDLQWAMDLEKRMQEGYEPNAQEVQRYQTLSQQIQTALAAQ